MLAAFDFYGSNDDYKDYGLGLIFFFSMHFSICKRKIACSVPLTFSYCLSTSMTAF